jgi:hypothetical protein
MHRIALAAAAAIGIALAGVTAAPAHADENSFLNTVTIGGPVSPAVAIDMGNFVCRNLRHGAGPTDGMGWYQAFTPNLVEAARNLST